MTLKYYDQIIKCPIFKTDITNYLKFNTLSNWNNFKIYFAVLANKCNYLK